MQMLRDGRRVALAIVAALIGRCGHVQDSGFPGILVRDQRTYGFRGERRRTVQLFDFLRGERLQPRRGTRPRVSGSVVGVEPGLRRANVHGFVRRLREVAGRGDVVRRRLFLGLVNFLLPEVRPRVQAAVARPSGRCLLFSVSLR